MLGVDVKVEVSVAVSDNVKAAVIEAVGVIEGVWVHVNVVVEVALAVTERV